ncbi:MAG TPA: adenylate/guanylate cyclase domain-containing protein [Chthoniobacterales bacterium]
MAPESHLQLEIAHVLFIDVVGYSKLLIDEQHEILEELNGIVASTEAFRAAREASQLIRIPTGDGMALVFSSSLEAPVRCALEIGVALRSQREFGVRMGIHSGPVSNITDINKRSNVAGSGINIAQRVMDCGDAGHILLSKRVAEDLGHYRRWQPHLHDLGECSVKHGLTLSIVNLYTEEAGNPNPPERFKPARAASGAAAPPGRVKRFPLSIGLVVAGLILFGVAVLGTIFAPGILRESRARARTRSAPAGSATPTLSSVPEKSIAVLPFENLSAEKANEFFADGMQDEILTDLAKIADLKVVSRMSVMQYKSGTTRNMREIGRALGVAHLLEGSVQRAGQKVRVNAQLIDARTDAHQWAQVYDRPLGDVFAIQSEIAGAIAGQLQAKLSPNEKAAIAQPPTADLAAFDDYTRAKTLLLTTGFNLAQTKNFFQAIEILDNAIARDPGFFAAYCQLVTANDIVYALGHDHTTARLALAESALQNAARLRPDAAETHLARAEHFYFGLRDYRRALAELQIARRTLVNDPRVFELSGYILRREGRHEEGLRDLEHAVALDPRNRSTLVQIALSYQFLQRYPEECVVLDRALAITPDDIEIRSTRALVDLLWKADIKPLREVIERIRTEQPASIGDTADNWFFLALIEHDWPGAEQALATLGNSPLWADGPVVLSNQFGEGLLARVRHDDARARKAFSAARLQQERVVQKQKDYGPALCLLGLIDAALGNRDAALKEGRRAMEVLPVAKDSINGQRMIVYFAMIAAWAGDKDVSLQELSRGAHTPGGTYVACYGVLKLFPFWDPLRGDPRFNKIVASLAPR